MYSHTFGIYFFQFTKYIVTFFFNNLKKLILTSNLRFFSNKRKLNPQFSNHL